MIKVNEIAFVGYPVCDRARAREFYDSLFGLKPALDSDMGEHFWTEYELGTSTFALSNYWEPAAEPKMGPAAAFEVEDFDATLARLSSRGVRCVDGPFESTVCHMAMIIFHDC